MWIISSLWIPFSGFENTHLQPHTHSCTYILLCCWMDAPDKISHWIYRTICGFASALFAVWIKSWHQPVDHDVRVNAAPCNMIHPRGYKGYTSNNNNGKTYLLHTHSPPTYPPVCTQDLRSSNFKRLWALSFTFSFLIFFAHSLLREYLVKHLQVNFFFFVSFLQFVEVFSVVCRPVTLVKKCRHLTFVAVGSQETDLMFRVGCESKIQNTNKNKAKCEYL